VIRKMSFNCKKTTHCTASSVVIC